jgi:integrase
MGVRINERPKGSGIWWIFISHHGKRKAKKIGKDKRLAREVAKKFEARLVLGELELSRDKSRLLFNDYARTWLDGYAATTLKYSTFRGYQKILKKHLLPYFGDKTLPTITRADCKQILFKKINDGLALSTVKNIRAVLSGIFTQAVEDGYLESNPVSKMGKYLTSKDHALGKEISPLTADELKLYIEICERDYPRYYPLFLTLSRTGMRLGEALGLQPGDIDFRGQFIEIKRGLVENRITTPKSGKTRRVDMTPQLAKVLKAHLVNAKEETLRKGWGELPAYLFINEEGKSPDPGNLRRRVHNKVCEKAGLRRIRIHDLRHSYATIRITAGHNIADISRQLGHSSYKITVDIYYHWMPNEKKEEVAELDYLGKHRQQSATYTQPEQKKASAKNAETLI